MGVSGNVRQYRKESDTAANSLNMPKEPVFTEKVLFFNSL